MPPAAIRLGATVYMGACAAAGGSVGDLSKSKMIDGGSRRKFQTVSYNAQASPRHFSRLERAAAACRLQAPIAATYPLAQAAKAHDRIEKGQVLGRIVLQIRSGSS